MANLPLVALMMASARRIIARDDAPLSASRYENHLVALREVAHVVLGAALRELEGEAALRALADERLAIRMTRELGGRWCVTARVVRDWHREGSDPT